MASSKARSRNRPSSGKSGRAVASKGPGASRTGGASAPGPARPAQPAGPAAAAAPAAAQAGRGKRQLAPPAVAPEPAKPAGPPLWLQIVTSVLALGGLGVASYETWAHYNGSQLFACSGNGSENCTAVITSPQSVVFGAIPVAIIGLVFYLFVVAIMSPWAWRSRWREIAQLRLAAMVAGMGFVMYLIYAELYQIGSWCLYCTFVHIITFVLFCVTVLAAALWGMPSDRWLRRSARR